MRRRALLATTGLVLAGGCTTRTSREPSRPENNSTSNDSDAPRDTIDRPSSERSTHTPTLDHFIIGKWLNDVPDQVDPYPADEEPLRSNDTLQDFLDDVVAKDLRPGTDEAPWNGQGEPLTRRITEAETDEVLEDLEAVEFSDYDPHPGRYVDHGRKYIWLSTETV